MIKVRATVVQKKMSFW